MIELIKGDCLEESEKIKSGSVDLILTDLPYGIIKGIGNNLIQGSTGLKANNWDNVIDTKKIHNIANRILRKNGKMLLFGMQPFVNELMNNAIPNLPFSYTLYWSKDHFANCLLSKKACVGHIEEILLFSKKYDFEGLHPLREYFKKILAYVGEGKAFMKNKTGLPCDHVFRVDTSCFSLCTEATYIELTRVFELDKMEGFKLFGELKEIDHQSTFNLWEGNKTKSSIFSYKKDYGGHHPTQKPVLLLEDLIKTFSDEYDLVVDLTMGSGSTGVACKNTNRFFTGIELDDNYFEIAKQRIGS